MEDKAIFKPKLRITLLTEDGVPTSDRLVDAYTELNTGPKLQHHGPVRIEVTLANTNDVNLFKTYMDRLSGTLPLKEPSAGRGRPAGSATKELESPREEILAEVENISLNCTRLVSPRLIICLSSSLVIIAIHKFCLQNYKKYLT